MPAHLDQNATTAAAPEAVTAMLPWLAAPAANPSAGHPAGKAAADALRAARGEVARLFGARLASEVVFTAGGTEAINAAVHAACARTPGRRRLITSTVEHSATKRAYDVRAAAGTHDVVKIGVDEEGRLDRAALFAAIDAHTACVSLMLANNETGVLFDLAGVAAACEAVGATFHIDAVQVPGKAPVDVYALGCHMASISGHKFHGPRGTGALFVRDGFPFAPTVVGGPQEGERRAGTENTPGIIGLGVAARIAREKASDAAACAALAARRDRLEAGLLAALPGARVSGAAAPRVPNTCNVTFRFRGDGDGAPDAAPDSALVLALLFEAGVEASAGSACSALKVAPSPVLLAMGRTPDEAARGLRFSLSHGTTDAEIDAALAAVQGAVGALQALA
ncbi:MAG: cysteine desulfurase family protein [Planctomycetota bacterium]